MATVAELADFLVTVALADLWETDAVPVDFLATVAEPEAFLVETEAVPADFLVTEALADLWETVGVALIST